MRNINIIKLLFLILMTTSSCDKQEEIPATGEPFGRANSLKFYFSNENSNDLLNLKDNPLLPVTYETNFSIPEQPSAIDTLQYYYCGEEIKFDTKSRYYYWNTTIPGKQGYRKNQFYVRLSEKDIDTMDVEFSFVRGKGLVGGDVYAYIDKLYYNGKLIMEECQNCDYLYRYSHQQVLIHKLGDRTTISFGD